MAKSKSQHHKNKRKSHYVTGDRRPKGQPLSVFRIARHYRLIGLGERVDVEEFFKLCQYMQVTTDELLALMCCKRANLQSWLKKGALPGIAAISLFTIRQFYTAMKTGILGPPIVPIGIVLCRGQDSGAISATDSPTTKPETTTTTESSETTLASTLPHD